MMDLQKLQENLGYRFKDVSLLELALTHPSIVQKDQAEDNQRLEFLGDAVFQICVSQALYDRYPKKREGSLTRRRAALVCEANLAELARRLGIGECLFMSRGEEMIGGRDNPSILCDAMEAVVAAVWLDGGYDVTVDLVNRIMAGFEPKVVSDKDAKSVLQEYMQARGEKAPSYEIVGQDGPPHARVFTARVLREDGTEMGQGKGARKQRAEEQAALAALELLKQSTAAAKERNPQTCD